MRVRSAELPDAPAIADLAHRAHRSAAGSAGLHELEVSRGTVEWGIDSPGLYWYVAEHEGRVVGYLTLQRSGSSVVVFSLRTGAASDTDETVERLLALAASAHSTAQFFLDVDPSLAVWFESRYQIAAGQRFAPFDPARIPPLRDRTPIGPWEPGAEPMATWSPALSRAGADWGAPEASAATHHAREQRSPGTSRADTTQQPPVEIRTHRGVSGLWRRAR